MRITQSSGNTVERLLAHGSCTGLQVHGTQAIGWEGAHNVARDIAGKGGVGIDSIATGPNNTPRLNQFTQNLVRRNAADGIRLRLGVFGTRYDLAEGNQACSNTWTGNTFVTKNQACIS